ncbi:MAG: V-type ATP synthase subunit D [Deltaproteobacteria bacterium]|nr:V-type ATP synthase subunit D [Deltaproteobacteria bacterium]PWB61911.1 MAG: V-type ATP synthase subunit D [Deltaproteobacteria bacterium]
MPLEPMSPTRTNLLALKGRERAAREGLSLLRSKREALVRELFGMMEQAVETRDLFTDTLQAAMRALAVSMSLEGRAGVESAAFAARRDIPLWVEDKIVWGVRFQDIRWQGIVRSADARGYAFSGVSSATLAASREFEKALEVVLRVVSVETRLKKIGAEISTTTRRVNAFTEVVLPELLQRIRGIRLALEEREREDVFRMKRFKKRNGEGPGARG